MKKILSLLIIVTSLSACSNDDDNLKMDPELNGIWVLTDINCFCGFDSETNINDFSLNFNNSENTVIVQNPREDYFYIANSGTFNYTLTDDGTLKINGSDDFKYMIDGAVLTLTRIDDPQIADDELELIYKRLQQTEM